MDESPLGVTAPAVDKQELTSGNSLPALSHVSNFSFPSRRKR